MKHLPVVIFGAGGVGKALISQIVESREVVARRNQLYFDVIAVADSWTWLWRPDGLSDEQLEMVVDVKQSGRPLGDRRPSAVEIVGQVRASGIGRALVVDVTASDKMVPVVDQALDMGYGVVLANKKPLAGPWEGTERYFTSPMVRFESTVGGGQPVIATLRYLLDTNDQVSCIEGQMSGTLGFICGLLDDGIAFSRALIAAKARGYTESDPREDLGGQDVMRKALILARIAGWKLEESDIAVEPLYDEALSQLSVSEFMEAAVSMDSLMAERMASAAAQSKVLRHVASVSREGGSVSLRAIPKDSPLAHLKYISFQTSRYEDPPLIVGGKGAGVEMTAAGVHGDMIGLAREQFCECAD